MLKNYMLVIGRDKHTIKRQRAILKTLLGAKGQRILMTLPNAGTGFDENVEALEKYFEPKINGVTEKYHFETHGS